MASAQRSAEPDSAPGGACLDLHEELPTPRCVCGPEHLRLRSEHGELVKPRGGAVNHCDYCAKLQAVENSEMLALDALAGDAPRLWTVLTTRTVTTDMARFYAARWKVTRAVRRRWPDAEYACLLEYTTGYGERSGGRRRPHWNLAWKGIPDGSHEAAHSLIARIWCQHVDAEPTGQKSTTIYSAENLFRYIALHFMKESQKPPAGFKGQRFNCSLRYFTGCTRATARARARDSLGLKRELWRAARLHDDAYEIELAAQLAHRRNISTRWTLASETGARLGLEPIGPELVDRLRALR
jgi:hypothetical protein